MARRNGFNLLSGDRVRISRRNPDDMNPRTGEAAPMWVVQEAEVVDWNEGFIWVLDATACHRVAWSDVDFIEMIDETLNDESKYDRGLFDEEE